MGVDLVTSCSHESCSGANWSPERKPWPQVTFICNLILGLGTGNREWDYCAIVIGCKSMITTSLIICKAWWVVRISAETVGVWQPHLASWLASQFCTCITKQPFQDNAHAFSHYSQMSIKHRTSEGQTRDQEDHLERSSFFYSSPLMVRTWCSTY